MIYKFKKGNHYPSNWLKYALRFLTNITFDEDVAACVRFSRECLTPVPENDINKLIGLSLALSHHKASVRFGWRTEEHNGRMRIALFAYTYCNGKRQFRFVRHVDAEQDVHCYIIRSSAGYSFLCWTLKGDVTQIFIDGKFPDPLIQLRLNPYHGGTFPAPCDQEIEVQWKKPLLSYVATTPSTVYSHV